MGGKVSGRDREPMPWNDEKQQPVPSEIADKSARKLCPTNSWWAGRGSNPQREANKGTLGTNPRPTAVAQSGAACRSGHPLLYV